MTPNFINWTLEKIYANEWFFFFTFNDLRILYAHLKVYMCVFI